MAKNNKDEGMERPFPAYQGNAPYFFVSYAHDDDELVYPEMAWLHEVGFNLWYDDGIQVGSVWRKAIADAVSGASALIFFATSRSVKSRNCSKEISFILDDDKPVFVVQLDDATLPSELRLSLSDRQAMIRSAFNEATYRSRLTSALGSVVEHVPVTLTPKAAPESSVADNEWESQRFQQGKIRFATSADGVRFAYALTGEGPPLVKAAHWLTNLDLDWQSVIWRHWLGSLADGHQLLRYDQRGCGLSDRNPEDLSLEAMVSDLETVVDEAGFRKFALLGASKGGPVTINYTVKHPDRVSALILYGSYAQGWARRGNPAEAESGRAMMELVRFGWGQDNPAFRQMFGSLFMPDANEEQREAFDVMQRESATPELAARLMEALGEVDVSDLLPQLSVPVLVLHARGDSRIPHELGRSLASGIPNAEFQSLDCNNHIIMEHEPAFPGLISAIRVFLKRIE
jgi:pimeloyl-ACP methyl ester carboxylesterase